MKKHPLIFDWIKPEASRMDKLYSIIIVALLSTFMMGAIKLNLPSHKSDSETRGTLIRFMDDDMAKSWALEAEENGPFPGRLESDGKHEAMMFNGDEGLAWWTDYKVKLRPIQEEVGLTSVYGTPQARLEFPIIEADMPVVSSKAKSLPKEPILIPNDAAALEWLPEELPSFDVPPDVGHTTDSLRFLVSLREDGSLAELIRLAGAADPAQESLETWLRGIRFKKGIGERWFGLRIDFVNKEVR